MKITARIAKADEHLVFGWASMATDKAGIPVVDSVGDVIPIGELEKAAYNFVEFGGCGGEMHAKFDVAHVVESVVFTPEKIAVLGLSGEIPQGWWIGLRVTDEEVWQKIKAGVYTMLSIGGRATREDL